MAEDSTAGSSFIESSPGGSTGDDEAARRAASRKMTDQMRRVINRMVVVRPQTADLLKAADALSAFGDTLDALPSRTAVDAMNEVNEAGLNPRDFVERSPLSGPANALAPPMTLRIVGDESESQHVEGTVRFGQAYEGPPGSVHGGFVAAMFDELLGYAQLKPGYTGQLTISFKAQTPLEADLQLKAWVDREEGRKRWVLGECRVDGNLVTTAEGLFIAPREGTPHHMSKPEAWGQGRKP